MLLGLCILLIGACLLMRLESWIHQQFRGISLGLAEHVYLPLARVMLVMTFLYAVYPSPMFSSAVLQSAPSPDPASPVWGGLLNILFLIGLMLPLLPETQRFGALILPLQSAVGVLLFVRHYEKELGIPFTMTAPQQTVLLFAATIICSHLMIRGLSRYFSARWRLDALSLYDTMVLCIQPPIALLISRSFSLQS